jgi:hypothetical protein
LLRKTDIPKSAKKKSEERKYTMSKVNGNSPKAFITDFVIKSYQLHQEELSLKTSNSS